MKKRMFSIILAILICIQLCSTAAFSSFDEPSIEYEEFPTEYSVSTYEEIKTKIQEAILLRIERITFEYESKEDIPKPDFLELIKEACEHTGVPTHGDSLYNAVTRRSYHYTSYSLESHKSFTLTYNFTYKTNFEEETLLTEKINEAITSFGFTDSTSDYEKVKTIYSFIINHVEYDYKNLNDPNEKQKYTPYAAMVKGKAVCSGYALLFYRMCLEVGVDCRYIDNDNHAWNIVKLNDLYYNVDATWGDGNYDKYFLKGSKNFPNHTPDSSYTTPEFQAEYPISEEDFDPTRLPPPPPPDPGKDGFLDVEESDWFYTPVLWAKTEGVTGGKTETTFAPEESCTRAQVVTFLWAANGKPEPASMENPFADVPNDAWYLKPVLWAVENGITGGVSEGKFGPEQTCTRAQIVTFLYAAVGKPAVEGKSTFSDVANTDWFVKPVLWAAQNDVTGGIGNGQFGPNNTCTRGQVVTFLYKVYGNK